MQTFIIPVIAKNEIAKKLDRLAKKAAAYNCNFSYSFGNETAVTRDVYETIEGAYGQIEKSFVRSENVFGIELTIDSDIIRKDGYTIIAGIDHDPGGNIVTVFDDTVKTNPAWYTIPAYCEHCGTRHAKKQTYILRDPAGHYKQVGRSCLKDYCGIDPAMIAACQEIKDLILNEYDVSEYDFAGTGEHAYNVCDMIALANDLIKQYGYVKSSEKMSTKDRLTSVAGKKEPSKESAKLAAEMKTYFAGLDRNDLTAYLSNVKSLLARDYIRMTDFGYIAYAPIAYKQMIEKQNKKESRNAGDYVGNVGDRITLTLKESKLVTSWETVYGMTWLYKFITIDGNTLVWYASKPFDGDPKQITGTVKDHKDYDGEKQTVLTRCRVM